MNKWLLANMTFVLLWLACNHPLDRALGITVGSTTDWAVFAGFPVTVASKWSGAPLS